eukprot:209760-Pyramimonas_sp.AAC.1
MEASAVASVTSWDPCGSTYYGHRSCGYIDHLILSPPWMGRVKKGCVATYNLARRLSAIPSVAIFYHMFIVAEPENKFPYGAPQTTYLGLLFIQPSDARRGGITAAT